MRDSRLVQLNFRELIDYGGQPPVQNSYTERRRPGYCVSCEGSGILGSVGGTLDLMSHGCDFSDFEHVLGPMPREGRSVEQSVLFLLENPGEDKGNGEVMHFRGFNKQPPIFHYYWTPNIDQWPVSIEDFANNFYGPYFAYLMRRHQFINVYITNLIKCRWIDGPSQDSSTLVKHCVQRFLAREIQFGAPCGILCFGQAAAIGLRRWLPHVAAGCRVVELYHPSYINDRWQTIRPKRSKQESQQYLVDENDRRVRQLVAQLV